MFIFTFMGRKAMEIFMSERKATIKEEIVNSITHGIGTALAISATAVSIVWAVLYGNVYSVVSASIYGATLIILYLMSTLYHAFTGKTVKKVFRIFDHCSIFLLIAGTYTPLSLVALNGALGWTIFGIIWAFSVLGIVLNSISLEKFKLFSLICYIAMGWMIIIASKAVIGKIGFYPAFTLLLAGGIFYTVGAVFYKMKNVMYMHGLWHIFVLFGSIFHYFCILFYVLPVK